MSTRKGAATWDDRAEAEAVAADLNDRDRDPGTTLDRRRRTLTTGPLGFGWGRCWVLAELGVHVGRRHEGFVLHRDGAPVTWPVFGHHWRGTRERASVHGIRFHDLRHAFASMLISAGCSVKAVSAALGALVGSDDVGALLAPLAGRRGPHPGRRRPGAGAAG